MNQPMGINSISFSRLNVTVAGVHLLFLFLSLVRLYLFSKHFAFNISQACAPALPNLKAWIFSLFPSHT